MTPKRAQEVLLQGRDKANYAAFCTREELGEVAVVQRRMGDETWFMHALVEIGYGRKRNG